MDLGSCFLGRLQVPAGEGYLYAFAGEFPPTPKPSPRLDAATMVTLP